MKKIVIAFDHRGTSLANQIKKNLIKNGYLVEMGESFEGDDYVDNAIPAIMSINNKHSDCAILICGTGIGMALVANRFKGIYAVHARENSEAYFARRHENANVLVLGAGYSDEKMSVKLSHTKAMSIVNTFLSTPFEGGRHQKRIDKVNKL